jgi:hypothetical protein
VDKVEVDIAAEKEQTVEVVVVRNLIDEIPCQIKVVVVVPLPKHS